MIGENSRFSAFTLERYSLGELTAEEKDRLESALALEPGLAERLAELRRSGGEILKRYPPERIIPRIQDRGASGNPRRFFRSSGRMDQSGKMDRSGKIKRSRLGPALLAVSAALLMIALPSLAALRNRRSDPALGDRAKGATELSVYLKPAPGNPGNSADLKLEDEAVLREGNTIQLAYMVNGDRYGVILSIDGRSVVTVHYPYGEGQSTRLVSGKRILLDEAYTLDDAPDYELFFFIIGDGPLDVGHILGSARELARNPKTARERSAALFKGYELKTFTLRKE
jgi:hypothetical protein